MKYENEKRYLLIAGDYKLDFKIGQYDYEVINTLEEMLDSVIEFCMDYGLYPEELIDKLKDDCSFTHKDFEEVL